MWKLLLGWIKKNRTNNFGMTSLGMANDGMTIGKLTAGIVYAWILSYATPQPFTSFGRWDDTKSWDDTRLWYD
jgi:hypothetical protein